MRGGLNQYPPMTGRAAPARARSPTKIETLYGHRYDAARARSPITAGATQAILTAILALVHPKETKSSSSIRAYDSYDPNIRPRRRDAGPRAAHARARFAPDFGAHRRRDQRRAPGRDRRQLAAQPERPGLVGTTEMQQLADLLRPTDIVRRSATRSTSTWSTRGCHQSVARHSRNWRRAASLVSSFGKTYQRHRLEGRLCSGPGCRS